MDTFVRYAMAAGMMAADDGDLKLTDERRGRVGVLVGTGMGGIPMLVEQHRILLEKGSDRVSPFFISGIIPNMASGRISMQLGAKGPNLCVSTACATGNHAIGDSFRIIQRSG